MMSRIYSILLLYLILLSHFSSKPNLLRKLEYSLTFDNTNWSYDSTNNVYYQVGVFYCSNPASTTHESLGIYVPGEYMTCTESNSKYTCDINSSGKKGSYTASNAPFVMPVDTSGYSAMPAPTSYSYSKVSNFIENGIIYIYAGCRGRYDDGSEEYYSGAPWGVTDLKAAIRFLRYNSALLPGDLNKFYTFGMSGGGAQSCLMGITGNSALFSDYLNEIKAAMTDADGNEIKDNIKGSQCWCPITNLDTADAAYEWNMGQYFSTNTREEGTFTKSLSNDLANAYYEYVNNLNLKDPDGNVFSLTSINEGTYYDYLKSVIEESLNNFLSDTSFPYTSGGSSQGNGGPGNGGSPPSGSNGGTAPSGTPPSGSNSGSPPSGSNSGTPPSGSNGGSPPSSSGSSNSEVTYETAADYINSLNSDEEWITYDNSKKKYVISSVEAFVVRFKSASKNVGAFDDLSKAQAENKLFGISSTSYTNHFDKIMSTLLNAKKSDYESLTNWNANYPDDYTNALSITDHLGKTIEERVNMYNPMYYLNEYYAGYNSADVADYFRINTGITQSDTSNVVEINLYLALLNYGKNAEFTTVWNQGHTEAERTGSAEDNFISWIGKIEGVSDSTTTSNMNFIRANFFKISFLFMISIF